MIIDKIENIDFYPPSQKTTDLPVDECEEDTLRSLGEGGLMLRRIVGIYSNISKKITKALTFLKNTNFIEQQDGKYPIEGNNLFYIVQRYQTKPLTEGKFEAHKKYIDIQYLVSGEELIGYTPLNNLAIAEPYNEQNDCAFYKAPEKITTLFLTPGSFAIFFPHDAHMPCRQLNTPTDILKVVVKVKY